MPRDTAVFHVSIRSDNGHIASYRFWKERPDYGDTTYLWMRSDGRNPAGGAVDHNREDPVSTLAARVLLSAGHRLKAPVPTMRDYGDDD